jgi:hypothetical protein
MHAIFDFLKSNWPYEALGLYLLGEVLSKIPKVRANTAFELLWNPIAKWLKNVPGVGPVAGLLDTPEAAPAAAIIVGPSK